jgi:HEAT repeat protein
LGDWDVVAALEAVGDLKANYIPDFIKALQNTWEPTAIDGALLLGSIGPKARVALPVLLEQMPTGDWHFSNVVMEALWKIDRPTNLALEVFTNELLTVRRGDELDPLRSLCEMGLAAEPAAPLVLRLFTNSDYRLRIAAATTLQKIDPALYRSTIDELNRHSGGNMERLLQVIRSSDSNRKSRMRDLEALAMYGSDARPAVPALIDILQCPPPKGVFPGLECEDAINVLAEIGPEARDAVPPLVALLPSKRFDIHPSDVCRALGNIGPGASAAVPALKHLLQSGDPWKQIGAATALARIDPEEKEYLAPILMTLTNFSYPPGAEHGENLGKDPRFSWPARVALWRLGLEKEPPVAEMMPPTSAGALLDALPLLGDIGPAAKAALPYLERIAESDQEIMYRRMAAIAIRKIDPQEAARRQLPGILALP